VAFRKMGMFLNCCSLPARTSMAKSSRILSESPTFSGLLAKDEMPGLQSDFLNEGPPVKSYSRDSCHLRQAVGPPIARQWVGEWWRNRLELP
jgi:hypothetical protein